MFSKAIELYNDGYHKCLVFSSLVSGSGIQSNQFLIIDGNHEAVIDPGGDLTFASLSLEIGKHAKVEHLDYIFASHQDPDIIASLGRWLMKTEAQVVVSKLWSRFLPHLVPNYLNQEMGLSLEERIIGLPDEGDAIRLGDSRIIAVPAHFLHSVGNFQFYDQTSKILFSGDMGASLVDDASKPVEDFEAHINNMKGFHQRYMTSNRACKLWANMVRDMDVEQIVPQHGNPFVGKKMVNKFLDWISELSCGVDLLTQRDFRPCIRL